MYVMTRFITKNAGAIRVKHSKKTIRNSKGRRTLVYVLTYFFRLHRCTSANIFRAKHLHLSFFCNSFWSLSPGFCLCPGPGTSPG